ncbi:hypothetical protein [Neobacillus vireti]|uniref:hypothetical protein n=1 Tax=Neobacillus vireti TaxID=220686 RepID=UPI002FFE5172
MKNKWKILAISVGLSFGLLAGCNVDKRNSLNQENDVNFRPVRNDLNSNDNESNNDYKNPDTGRFIHDMEP